MDDLRAQKAALRKQALAARRALSPLERAAKSRRICAAVAATAAFRRAKTVMGYMPLADEVDVRPLLRLALTAGKTAALPRVDDSGAMRARIVENLAAAVCAGYKGILEPRAEAPILAAAEIDLIIMPAAAADPNGNRIGYGGGFYDRFAKTARGYKIAVVFARQLLTAAPYDLHDVRADAVVCERGAV